MLKWILVYSSCLIILWTLTNCGGGSSTSNGTPSASVTNFSGTYHHVDDNCTGVTAFDSFIINQSTKTLADVETGDVFDANYITEDGSEGIESTDLGCRFTFINNQADLDEFKTVAPNIQSSIGNLAAVCGDGSADNQCALTYTK